MRQADIEVGKMYKSKAGKAERRVLEMGVRVQHYDREGTISDTGVSYIQERGPYAGKEGVLPLKSFAQWAHGEV